MYKETIISGMIILIIIIGNIMTQNYTKESVETTSNLLNDLKEEIQKEEKDLKITEEKIDKIHEEWDERHQKLAYYIEHDELEKVETNLTSLRSFITTESYEDAQAELEKSIYVLEHIKEKNAFHLQNIF